MGGCGAARTYAGEKVAGPTSLTRAAQHVAGGRPGSERAARYERSSERGRGPQAALKIDAAARWRADFHSWRWLQAMLTPPIRSTFMRANRMPPPIRRKFII